MKRFDRATFRTLCALLVLLGGGLALSGCADANDRSPWHQYLHDHGME